MFTVVIVYGTLAIQCRVFMGIFAVLGIIIVIIVIIHLCIYNCVDSEYYINKTDMFVLCMHSQLITLFIVTWLTHMSNKLELKYYKIFAEKYTKGA